MALDYRKCASEIYENLGGRENLVSVAHCATRLRLVTVDNNKIDTKKLEDIDGVMGVFKSNGQLQLIIGTGTVNKVYAEFLDISGMTESTKEEVKAAAAANMPILKRFVKVMGDVFVPILPAIVASGLMMGIVEALGKASTGFHDSDWFSFLDLLANTAFVFLPAIIAISSARVFGGNIFLGAVIGMLMIHPNLINAWSVGGMTESEIPVWNLFGSFSIRQVGYQGHVIPIIIAVWIMSMIEKRLHKHVPEMIDLFVTPLVTVMATAFLTLGFIGPVFSIAENYVLDFAGWVITVGRGAGAMIMGALYPFTVVGGIHHMYNVIEAGMLSVEGGLNTWMPIASAANFAQGAACLAVGLKAKNAKTKSVAIPSALSAALGITEPAIFGINLRFAKPLLFGAAGGAVGALLGAVLNIGATAYGVTGIPGFLITLDYSWQYVLMLAAASVVAFSLTWVFWKEEAKAETSEDDGEQKLDIEEISAVHPDVLGEEANEIYSPVKGKVISRVDIPDETFATGVLGDGVGIEPYEGVIVAPFEGVVSSVADTKHAVGIKGPEDMELLIHVGIDTVNMHGEGFQTFVKEGDMVWPGQKLMTFDINKIKKAGYSATTAVLLTNSDEYPEFNVVKLGETEKLERIMRI